MTRRAALILALPLVVILATGTWLSTKQPAQAGVVGVSGELAALTADPVIAAAGDIACDPANSNFNAGLGTSENCRQRYTSDLLLDPALSAVLVLGDNQYYCGGYQAHLLSYDKSWGRVKAITRPVVGNHEYLTSGGTDCNSANRGAAGYFRYFGAAAGDPGKGYYSYDIGSWHLIALNSNCGDAGGCGSSSPQGQWLRADLAAHANFCTLAYWHIPLFSSGGRASNNSRSFWDALYEADADLVLVGHDHTYERFAPQRPTGVADSVRGIRQFVVGTGGSNHTSFTAIWPNSESRNATAFGVLKLTLRATSYDWQFVPEAGSAFTDSGTTQCHGTVADTTPPTAPGNLTASAVAPNQIDLSWSGSTDDFGVVGYRLSRDGAVLTTVTSTSYSDTGVQPNSTHVYTVVAIDEGGNSSPVSNPATASTPADTSPPSPPFNLIATAPNGFLVDLVWGASTDDVGVSEYEVFRDGLAVGTSSTTSFADTTVDATTTYSYTVVARDSSTNRSEPSNVATVTTPAPPTTLSFTPSDDAYVQSDQTASNFGLAGQLVADASPSRRILLKFAVTGVRGRQVVSAKLYLRCVDPSSNGGDFRRADSSWSESTVTWSNQPVADSVARSSLGSVAAGSTYEVDVTSLVTGDGVHTIRVDSTSSNGAYYSSKEGSVAPRLVLTTTSSSSDTMKPTAPTNLVATAPTTNAVELVWSESTDDVGVTAYDVFRADLPAKVGTTSTTSFSDTNVQPNSTYGYHVVARDAAGNASDPSATTFVTTPASSTLTFTPNDDAFIDSTRPTSSFGSTASLEVDNSPVKHVLLKFTVTGAQGRTVTGARLRLRCVDPATSGGSFHRVSNLSWSETTVTWNSAPAADSSAFGMLGAVSTGNWYEITVPFITGDGTYAIRITSQSSNGADYSAKEGSFAPQLVISLS